MSGIVGPDGQPIDKKPAIDPAEAAAQFQKDMVAKQKAMADEFHKRMKAFTEEDRDAMDLSGIMLLCYRMIDWAKSELFGHCGAKTDLIEYIDRYMKAAAGGKRGFTLKQLIVQMKQEAIPLADKFYRTWEAHRTRRTNKLRKIASNLEADGVFLPTPKMRKVMEGIFKPGELVVLHGERGPVLSAILHMVGNQLHNTVGSIYRLSDVDTRNGTTNNSIVSLPPKWWKNSASHIRSLYEALKPVVEDASALVFVEDLELMYCEDPDQMPSHMRRQLALSRLYQWARENYVAVVVGDVVTPETFDAKLYGPMPHFGVTTFTLDGVESIFIDGEAVEVNRKGFAQ